MLSKMKQSIAAAAFIPVCVAPAQAVDFAADAHVGTMGPGVGVAFQVTRNLNIRGGLNSYSYDDYEIDDEEGLEYSGELKWSNQYVFADWYPTRRSKFRLTVGMYANGNEITGSARVLDDGDAQVGPKDAAAGTRVDATISFSDASGYLGVGYGNAFGRGMFSFGVDVGLVYQGSPVVDMTVTLPESLENCDPGSQHCITEEDVDAEREDVEDELSDYDTLPLVNVSFGISF